MNATQTLLIDLIRAALMGKGSALAAEETLAASYDVAASHGVVALFYYGARACGMGEDRPTVKKAAAVVLREAMHGERQMVAARLVTEAFEAEGIDYLPLKGIRQKKLYPKAEMRAMGDLDILVREKDYPRILPIMEKIGMQQTGESDHEYIFSGKGLMVELHRRLIPSYNKDYYAYFGDGWNNAVSVGGSHLYEMSPEDEFVYLFIHFAKHYRDAGIGLRHITDLYVFLKHHSLNENLVEEKLSRLGVLKFYQNVCQAMAVLFDGAEPNEITAQILQTVFGAGVYGTEEAHLRSDSLRLKTKDQSTHRIKRTLRLLFPTATVIKLRFPVVEKHPLLMAIYWPYYTFARLFDGRKRAEFKQRYSAMDAREISLYESDLQKVGLDFDFSDREDV